MSKFKLPSKLRNAAPKMKELLSLGFYYADDQDCGFMIEAPKNNPIYHILKKYDEEIRKCFKLEMDAIARRDAAMGYDVSLELFQLDIRNNMILGIAEWNRLHGYDKRPMRGENFRVEIGLDSATDSEKMQALWVILTGIIYMTEWGMLPNDNFNGPNYMYSF